MFQFQEVQLKGYFGNCARNVHLFQFQEVQLKVAVKSPTQTPSQVSIPRGAVKRECLLAI